MAATAVDAKGARLNSGGIVTYVALVGRWDIQVEVMTWPRAIDRPNEV